MRSMVASAGALLLGLACGEPDVQQVTFATYNTGLSPGFVDYATDRPEPVASALAGLEADVLCVQELVIPADLQVVEDAVRDRWPTALYLQPEPGEATEAPCTEAELEPLVACAISACDGLSSDALAGCVLESCAGELAAVSSGCVPCLASQLGSELSEVLAACTDTGGAFAYEGAFGVGLFTGASVVASDTLSYESSLTRQGAVYARLDLGDTGEVHVFCTHLTALLEDVPYPGEGSWQEEQGAQVTALLGFVADKAGPREPVVILGDLNTGPPGPGWTAQTAAHYQQFLAAGFEDPFAEGPNAACTWCPDNTLVSEDDDGSLIDHVLVRGLAGEFATRRLFTDPVAFGTAEGTVTAHLSDHYGVSVTWTPEGIAGASTP